MREMNNRMPGCGNGHAHYMLGYAGDGYKSCPRFDVSI